VVESPPNWSGPGGLEPITSAVFGS
jgi:hypothetical protein